MSHGVNRVILVGNVGKDPELKVCSGSDVVFLSLATSSHFKDKTTGENKQTTQWHKICFWGKSASVVMDYVVKGTKMYIEGSLQNNVWIDQNGIKHFTTEIRSDLFEILSFPVERKRENGHQDLEELVY